MNPDILRYNTNEEYKVCTKPMTRRELHDIVRVASIYGRRVVVCDCLEKGWVRSTLSFFGARWFPATKQCQDSSTSSASAE